MLKGEGTLPPSLKHDLLITQVFPHPDFSHLFEDFHQAQQVSLLFLALYRSTAL